MAKSLLILAHTPSPNTTEMAAAMANACRQSLDTLSFRMLPPLSASADDLLSASGVLLFTPENFGSLSGALKDFFERIYYPCIDRTQGMPYCLCVRAGHDNGSGAAAAVGRIVTGLRWREAQPALLCAGPYNSRFPSAAAEFAATFAMGLEMGIF
jgi:NAD(P)H-dependent FMN reductase